MRFCFFLLATVTIFNSYSQKISTRLSERMDLSHKNDYHRIRVEFVDNVNSFYWNQQFKQNQVPLEDRPRLIIRKLTNQAQASQQNLLNELRETFFNEIDDVQPFWIVNMIVLQAKRNAIEFISEYPGVAIVALEESRIQMNEYIQISESNSPKSVGGSEPGLIAINAPALWAMGYTGKGQVVYDYDTGVWPQHPAFADRFMGNFYPLEQSWLGYYREEPTGIYSSHGTHTLGTMAGLDTSTNDTIGCAFNAYWIACDHIRGTVPELPPITDMVLAFEWALNPDGDPSTTHDIPDVINNSWRWYDNGDTAYCGGFVVNLMNTIEAAGIANVFSGGNFGPSNTTISSPQRINTSDVNTFSVGSVNGNTSFPYPISSFSSRGPKQCPGSGSLAIHPEVVAPGQNVRSAWGKDGYNSISGTSMAAPHVSGACLLLKEAFPMVSGEEILRALYQTATDLGTVGEDNTFGMGIIDCLAAFDHLALTHTPVDPNNIAYDIAIIEVNNPSDQEVTCANSFSPSVTILNLGDSTITDLIILDSILGSGNTTSWSGTLLSGEQTTINLPTINVSNTGPNVYQVIVSIADSTSQDIDLYNNRRMVRFNVRPELSLPFLEKFENGITADWLIRNEDDQYGWETDSTEGLNWNAISATMQHFWYNPIGNQVDELLSPNLSTGVGSNLFLKFDRAYEDINSTPKQDTLAIYLSTDCGQTWPHKVFEKWGSNLATIDTVNLSFTPTASHHWQTDSIDISGFASSPTVMIKFQAINRKGQNLYIDNVRVYDSQDPVSLATTDINGWVVYPNPSNGTFYVEFPNQKERRIEVFDMGGKLVKSKVVFNRKEHIDLSGHSSGQYIIRYNNNRTAIFLK